MASALALATEKLPEICALPPRIGSLIDGAESPCPSSTIAKRLPTFCDVTRATEIGRASCRERVSQDVYISVVAVLYKIQVTRMHATTYHKHILSNYPI